MEDALSQEGDLEFDDAVALLEGIEVSEPAREDNRVWVLRTPPLFTKRSAVTNGASSKWILVLATASGGTARQ